MKSHMHCTIANVHVANSNASIWPISGNNLHLKYMCFLSFRKSEYVLLDLLFPFCKAFRILTMVLEPQVGLSGMREA